MHTANITLSGEKLKAFCLSKKMLCAIPNTVLPKQQKFISHTLETGKSNIKMPADSVPGKSLLPGLQAAPFMYPHMVEREVNSFVTLLIKTKSHT